MGNGENLYEHDKTDERLTVNAEMSSKLRSAKEIENSPLKKYLHFVPNLNKNLPLSSH